MDCLEDISSMSLIVVGVLVRLVPFLHLYQKCIQSCRRNLCNQYIVVIIMIECSADLVNIQQVMSLKDLMSDISQRLVSAQSLCLKYVKIPTIQRLQHTSIVDTFA